MADVETTEEHQEGTTTVVAFFRALVIMMLLVIIILLVGCTGPIKVKTPVADICIPTDLYPCQPIIIKDPRNAQE